MTGYEVKIQQYKIDSINSLMELFQGAKNFIFTDYRGLTVEQINSLRNLLRQQKTTLRVVKNRYAKLALARLNKPDVGENLIGPTAVAFTADDASQVVKALFEFSKETNLKVKGGLIDDNVFTSGEVEEFSRLPSKKELIAKLMGTIQAPVQNFVFILNAVPQKFVRTLQAILDKRQEN